MIDVYKFELTRDQLAAMPDDEREFYFFLGLATNEISCLSKLVILSGNVRDENEIIDHVHSGQALICLKRTETTSIMTLNL